VKITIIYKSNSIDFINTQH